MHLKLAIRNGIGAHGMWKQRLKDAIHTGNSDWSPALVCKDDQCEFGKWLNSCSLQEKSSEYYRTVKELHAEFHKAAADVLKLALAGKQAEATTAVSPSSNFVNISGKLIKQMMSWSEKAA